MLTIQNLINTFNSAKELKQKYVAVKIQVENSKSEEIIINPIENFDKKLEYYKKAYNEDLTLKANTNIKITGFTFRDNFGEIEKDLLSK